MEKISKYIDLPLITVCIMITIFGLIAIYSAVHNNPYAWGFLTKQSVALAIGIIFMLIFSMINYHVYYKASIFSYILAIIFLVGVLVVGKNVRGAKSWFEFGGFSFQPAEFAKVAIILTISVFLDKHYKQRHKLSLITKTLFIAGMLMGLILLQPDFGSMLVFIPIVFGLLFINGCAIHQLCAFLLYGTLAMGIPLYMTYMKMSHPGLPAFSHPIVWLIIICFLLYGVYYLLNSYRIRVPLSWLIVTYLVLGLGISSSFIVNKVIKDYQRKRLVVFLNPELDRLGTGYNVIQSKIAVGSGGLLGKGLFGGTQGQLGFLPERHTDFIFALVGEELGFLGAGFLIFLFAVMLRRIYLIALNARDRLGSLIAGGIFIMFCFYIVINIGVTMGLMPVTGIPLPFVSYGGSSLIISFTAIGIVLNIGVRRYTN